MSKDIEAGIEQDIYMGKIPVLSNERIYNFRSLTLTTAGIGAASWCYVQGGWIGSVLPLPLAIIATVLPIIVVGLLMMPIVTVPTRLGVDNYLIQSATFGPVFARALFLICIFTGVGWYVINAQVMATAVIRIAKYSGSDMPDSAMPWLACICFIVGCFFAICGPKVMAAALKIMVPCLVGIGIFLLIRIVSTTSLSELTAVEPYNAGLYSSTKEAFIIMVEGSVAFMFAWYPILGQMGRVTTTNRASYWGHNAGFGLTMTFFIIIGILSTAMMARSGIYSDNPTQWEYGGAPFWNIIAMLAIIFGNIGAQIVGVYAWSLTTKSFWPKLDFKLITVLWTAYCILLNFWGWVWTYYGVFLAIIGVSCGVACAIITADYFVVRRNKFSLKSIFQIDGANSYKYSNGFNLIALAAFAVGVVFYYLAYDPINYMIKIEAFAMITPTGIAYVTSFLTYILLSRVPAVRKYLLKDREEVIK